jgi:RHS repeat-associated protein
MTPHSGGTGAPYNHTSVQFWPSGALNQLSGPGLPTLTYSPDGEGRPSTVSDGSGHGPVTSTVYNLYTTPPQLKVTLGSGDSDVFSFDPNTFRLSKYQFNIGSQSVVGTLGWNANWSLGSLSITDPFSSANTQNCSYTADDVARISQANCGTIWGQNFTYDPFGNIQKKAISGDGGTTFAPCYQSSPSINNRISLVGGTGSSCTGGTPPTYDLNGNSLNDTFHTSTWDAENRPVTIGSVTLTYDALGRMAEQSVSSANSEVVYSALGAKLALMNGTTLTKAFAPLPGGDIAVYTSSGQAAYYRHTDHLGSSRFASTPSQTLYSDMAYSAFGETYASSGSIDASFTGQNQDTLAGLYDFLFREYDPNQSRWTSPDPAGLGSVDPSTPQSWNRYVYVLNNPLRLTDPFGLYTCIYLSDDGNSIEFSDTESDSQTCTDTGGQEGVPDQSVTVNGDDPGAGDGLGGIVGGGGGSALDNRANALANAFNKTGVQSLGNPCTVALFYGSSASAAVSFSGTAAGASLFPELNATITALKATAVGKLLPYAALTAAGAKFVGLLNGASNAVQKGCNALQ